MDEQTAARLRLVEARLVALESAVRPKPIRRTKSGIPRQPKPWEPGDAEPITDWLALRLLAFEHVFGFVLRADELRSEDDDAIPLIQIADGELDGLEVGESIYDEDVVQQVIDFLRTTIPAMPAVVSEGAPQLAQAA